MTINRTITNQIRELLDHKKAIIIKGARQVGKTTLIKQLLSDKQNVLWIDGDDPQARQLWHNINKATLQLFIADYDFIVFDEAQRIENIGLTAKMILDLQFGKQVILTGSSSLNLASSLNEPLTGRKWSFELFPFSWKEIVSSVKLFPAVQSLESLMLFGAYPEIYLAEQHKTRRLRELANSYLYKDVLELGKLKKPELIVQLLQALAYQIGSEVSYNELAKMLQADNETIKKYIGLLEDSYVIFRLPPLSRNPRKEISKSRKIYFYDTGIRNALINNFNPISNRNDIGHLWENFIIAEFKKKTAYTSEGTILKYWRSKSGAEIDLIIENGPSISAYEIKYNPKRKAKFPTSFIEYYQPQNMKTIHQDNFFEFL